MNGTTLPQSTTLTRRARRRVIYNIEAFDALSYEEMLSELEAIVRETEQRLREEEVAG